MTSNARDRAVVLGGSIAGLLAARVLTETFAEVVVMDRDDLDADASVPAPARVRRGTPQARHLHGLLARGQKLIEDFFPGLTSELVAAGAPVGDMLGNCRVCFGGHRFRQGTSGLTALCVSRPTLESAVRARVAELPGVRLLGARDVVGLVADRGGRRVLGARLIRRADGSAEEQAEADLVVDASGRGSRLPVWLDALGYPPPVREQVHVGVGYASRRYRLPAGALGEDIVLISAPTPARPRGGGLSRLEDGTCLVTLIGVLGDHPPTEPDAFARFASNVALPDLRNVLAEAQPVDDPVAHRHPTSLRSRYDRLRRFPEGLAVIGDAVCALNPVYGQGMTVAALEAAALRRHLADRRALRAHAYLHEIGRISGVAWALALGADLAFPRVDGRRTAATRLLARYVDRVQAGAEHDVRLGTAFLRVSSLVDPPSALVRPSVVARSLGRSGQGRMASERATVERVPAERHTGG